MKLWKNWGSWAIYAGGMCVFLVGVGNYWSATWLSKWAILLGLFGGMMSLWAARRTSLAYLPLMLAVYASLLMLGVWPENPYQAQFDQVTVLALQKNALYALATWTACLIGFSSIRRECSLGVRALLASIWAIGVFGTLALPLHGSHSAPNNGMWFGNPSMGASLLACLLPFAWALGSEHVRSRKHFRGFVLVTWCLTLAAIAKTQASVPWGVLGVVTCALIAARRLRTWKAAFRVGMVTIAIAGVLLFSGELLLGHDFWDQNGRFEIWGMAWRWFWEHSYPSVGMGFSSSQILIPIEQTFTGHYHGSYFLWLHNDWLQLAIEGGWIGMTCVFLALSRLLIVSWSKPALFGSLAGFITLACFNYPLRMPIHCMCILLICAQAEAYATRSLKKNAPKRVAAAEKSRLRPLSASVRSGV